MIDNVRVLYATAKKEYASDAPEGSSVGTTSWIINPEAGENEPQIYTYVEKAETIADSAIKSNKDMEAMVKDGRRYRFILAKSSEAMTIANYNQCIKDALLDVADIVAQYTQVTREVDGVQKILGCLPMDGIHSLDRVFCASPALDMHAYTYTPDEDSKDEDSKDGTGVDGTTADATEGDCEEAAADSEE